MKMGRGKWSAGPSLWPLRALGLLFGRDRSPRIQNICLWTYTGKGGGFVHDFQPRASVGMKIWGSGTWPHEKRLNSNEGRSPPLLLNVSTYGHMDTIHFQWVTFNCIMFSIDTISKVRWKKKKKNKHAHIPIPLILSPHSFLSNPHTQELASVFTAPGEMRQMPNWRQGWVQWWTSVILTLGSWGLEDQTLKPSLGHRVSLGPAWITNGPGSKNKIKVK